MDIPKNKISALFITYNEILNIDEVIQNVSFADEIIIIDSFSTDGTAERIKSYPEVKLIQRHFKDYTDQKSFALTQASHDWILFMDADERLTDELRDEVIDTLKSDPPHNAYYFYRTFMFQQKVLRFSGWQSDKNFRLFRKSKVRFTLKRIVHETLVVEGTTGIMKNKLIHFSYKDYHDYKGKMIKYGKMKALEELEKNYIPNLYHFRFKPAYKFLNHYIFRFGFLDGKKGVIISYLNALSVHARYQELKRLKDPFNPIISTADTVINKSEIKFLVIQQKMIGDVLASTIICECLKYHFPSAEIHMVANENTLPVLKENPFIDKIVIFKKEYRDSKIAFYRFLKSLKKTEYSAVIDAYGKLESNLITLFAKSDKKIGMHKWYTSWIYSDPIYQPVIPHNKIPLAISNRLMLLDRLIPNNEHITYPKLYLNLQELEKGKSTIQDLKDSENQKIIMISILGSGPEKTYPPNYMAQVLDIISTNCDAKLLFNYIPQQKKQALEIYNLCSLKTQNSIEIDFYAHSLRDFMGVLSQCNMIIGNEGGAINMAKALNIPSFCFFSPFILKGAWHGKVYENHYGVHLRDYLPELFGNMDKNEIKKNIADLYEAFEPKFFKEELIGFLNKNCS